MEILFFHDASNDAFSLNIPEKTKRKIVSRKYQDLILVFSCEIWKKVILSSEFLYFSYLAYFSTFS